MSSKCHSYLSSIHHPLMAFRWQKKINWMWCHQIVIQDVIRKPYRKGHLYHILNYIWMTSVFSSKCDPNVIQNVIQMVFKCHPSGIHWWHLNHIFRLQLDGTLHSTQKMIQMPSKMSSRRYLLMAFWTHCWLKLWI